MESLVTQNVKQCMQAYMPYDQCGGRWGRASGAGGVDRGGQRGKGGQ